MEREKHVSNEGIRKKKKTRRTMWNGDKESIWLRVQGNDKKDTQWTHEQNGWIQWEI